MEHLNENTIRSHIDTSKIHQPMFFHLLDTVDSTNRFLKDLPFRNGATICCAETQTHGRGRFGRKWHSPPYENIYFSVRLGVEGPLSHFSGLSLVTSLAILETLNELGLNDNFKIKWPNDILWYQTNSNAPKKLSGCLIELITNPNQPAELIIGIGLNVNSQTDKHPLPDKSWCSLLDITGMTHNRNLIIGKLINHLFHHINQLSLNGFQSFSEQWQRADGLKGQAITLTAPNGIIHGLASGVTQSGQLILIDGDCKTHFISSGEYTLA
jgi:BirA family biotin operon repressor/biotin-[acetyl-CoA-carboxylase] ligase